MHIFICRKKIHTNQNFQITLFLFIHELCGPSNPSHLTLSSFPAQYFLHEIHVRMNSAMQLVLERSSDGFSSSK